jgi:iron complex transport system ATP-binding protein
LTPALQGRGLRVVRGGRLVVDDVSLSMAAGEILAVVGPNGSGKSTLLKALAGLCVCEGQVTVGGVDMASLEPRARARLLAYVPQHSALESALPVEDVVAQGRLAHRSLLAGLGGRDREAMARAMADADVTHLGPRPFNQLSYGERRRVLLARALATEAPVLLLDEPTAALDVRHVLILQAIVQRLAAAGKAILVVLHPLHEVLAMAGAAMLLDGGRVAARGSVTEVIAAEPIRRVYGVQLVPGGSFDYRLLEGPRP